MVWAFFEAAGTVKVFQGGEWAARDLLGSGDDPLEHFPFLRRLSWHHSALGQALLLVHTQEPEIRAPLHTFPADKRG